MKGVVSFKSALRLFLLILNLTLVRVISSSQHQQQQQQQQQQVDRLDQLVQKLKGDDDNRNSKRNHDNDEFLSAEDASSIASSYIMDNLQSRITKMFGKNVKTPHCRAKVAKHLEKYISAIANEEPLPFSEIRINNQCLERPVDFDNLPEGVTIESIMSRKYQPPKNTSVYIDSHDDLKLLYAILTHGINASKSTIRLIETLNDSSGKNNTIFVVHVDGKEESDDAHRDLVEYAMDKDHVHILPSEFRVRANWGGFSMVNATYVVYLDSGLFIFLHIS